jgi:hypothetical protein
MVKLGRRIVLILSLEYFLSIYFNFLITIAAIYRSPFFRFERHLGTFTALSAGSREQPSFRLKIRLPVIVAAAIHLACLSGLTARRAALGSMKMPFGLVRHLLFYRKNKGSTTIKAVD